VKKLPILLFSLLLLTSCSQNENGTDLECDLWLKKYAELSEYLEYWSQFKTSELTLEQRSDWWEKAQEFMEVSSTVKELDCEKL
jgi:hypothetical protein